jgi:hypothetical protein
MPKDRTLVRTCQADSACLVCAALALVIFRTFVDSDGIVGFFKENPNRRSTMPIASTALKTPFRGLLVSHSKAELAALHTSFELNGVIDQLEVAAGDVLLNGHARYDWLVSNKKPVYIKIVGGLSTPEQQKAYILAKHLGHRAGVPNSKQINEYIDVLLIAHPELSDNAIAAMLGGARSHMTVWRHRKDLARVGKIKELENTIDVKGVKRKISRHASKKQFAELPVFFSKTGEEAQYICRHLDTIAPLPDVRGIQSNKIRIARLANRHIKQQEVLALPDPVLATGLNVYHSDFRNLEVADNSVDLICTDVLWAVENKKDWEALSDWARRKLKPHGLFCSLHGVLYIPQTADAFGKHLCFQTMIIVKYKTGLPIMAKSINSCWRPAWVYSRPEGIRTKFGNMWNLIQVDDGPADASKTYHEYQQSVQVFAELVRRLSRPGDLVCDPQCGTGTTGVACRRLGRLFLGGDRDEKMVKIARHRIVTEGAPADGDQALAG